MQNKPLHRPITASFYFFYYAAGASLVPFLALFYAQMGFSGSQIGLLSALPPVISLVASPFWTALADATQHHKRILLLTMLGAMFSALLILWSGSSTWLIPGIACFALFTAPIMPLMDNETLRQLGEQKQQYGKIRLWGAIGWGIAAPLMGFFIEQQNLRLIFWVYTGLIFISLVISRTIKFSTVSTTVLFWSGIRTTLKNPHWILFLSMVFLGSMTLSTVSNFLFLYMDSQGISKGIMGFALTIATLSEVPILFLGSRLLQRFSAYRLMLIALAFTGLRVFLLSFTGTPVTFLLIQFLHGMTFSLAWIAGVSFADEIAPAGLSATAQGIYAGIQLGVGTAVGAMLGGWLYQVVGPVIMYRILAGIVAMGVLIFILIGRYQQNQTKGMFYAKTI
jgi:PPP family 3-phenylpropionic acid transporter